MPTLYEKEKHTNKLEYLETQKKLKNSLLKELIMEEDDRPEELDNIGALRINNSQINNKLDYKRRYESDVHPFALCIKNYYLRFNTLHFKSGALLNEDDLKEIIRMRGFSTDKGQYTCERTFPHMFKYDNGCSYINPLVNKTEYYYIDRVYIEEERPYHVATVKYRILSTNVSFRACLVVFCASGDMLQCCQSPLAL